MLPAPARAVHLYETADCRPLNRHHDWDGQRNTDRPQPILTCIHFPVATAFWWPCAQHMWRKRILRGRFSFVFGEHPVALFPSFFFLFFWGRGGGRDSQHLPFSFLSHFHEPLGRKGTSPFSQIVNASFFLHFSSAAHSARLGRPLSCCKGRPAECAHFL